VSEHDPGAEVIDVLDDAGRVIGQTTRREMRARRLPHRCVYILVFDSEGRLFVHLRTAVKDVYPSHWDAAVGGVLGAGESFERGAQRELAEELGVDAPLRPLFPFRYDDPATFVHAMVYAVTHDGPFTLQASEIVEGRFVDWTAFDVLVARVPVCPDSLAVVTMYRGQHRSGGSPCRS
jgi:isopentenyldiphosphate isomerase